LVLRDLVLQKRRLIQLIQVKFFNEVQKIGANKKYDFIFDKSAECCNVVFREKTRYYDLVVTRKYQRTRKISAPNRKQGQEMILRIGRGRSGGYISDANL